MTSVELVVVVRDGAATRHERCVLEVGGSLTIGRGWHCDLIVQDPQVDAEHARISLTEAGELTCTDAGSLNGVSLAGSHVGASPQTFASGSVLNLGRASLAVFRTDHAVAPAVEPSRWDAIRVQLEKPLWAVSSLVLLLLCRSLELFGSTSQEITADTFVGLISYSLLACGAWVFFWGGLSKLLRNSAHLSAHLSIAAGAGIAVFLLDELAGYLSWQTLNIDVEYFVVIAGVALLMFFVGALTLGVATKLRRRRLLVLAGIPGVLLLASTYLLPLFRDTDVARYPELVTSSYPPGWQLSGGVTLDEFKDRAPDLFAASAERAKERAEELAAEKREGSGF